MFADPFGDGSNPLGVSYGAVDIATAISAVVGTVLAGLLANLPLAQASGMGLNAFFVYTVCIGFGLSYANALVLILLEGMVFILLTVTGLRKKVFDSLPDAVSAAIPAGIGLFITFSVCRTRALLYRTPPLRRIWLPSTFCSRAGAILCPWLSPSAHSLPLLS